MARWLYKNILVFEARDTDEVWKEKDGTWHDHHLASRTYYAGGGLLDSQRDWQSILDLRGKHPCGRFLLAWREDAGCADLAEDVIGNLGSDGWELVAIDGWTTENDFGTPACRYVFKKPQP